MKDKVTERLKKEIERLRQEVSVLKAAEAQRQDLANSLPDAIFEMNLRNIVTFANRAAERIFGYTKTDIKKGIDGLKVVIPKDRKRAYANIRKVLNGEKLGPNEYTGQTRNGKTLPVVIHTGVIKEGRKTIGVRGVMVDISKIKHTEDLIRRANEELEKKIEKRTRQLAKASEKLERVFEGTIIALSSTVEKRDPYTAGHQHRVAQLSSAIAEKMGLSPHQVKGIKIAAEMHDISKIYIPAEI